MHCFYLRQIVANLYTWTPYLHTCNPNLHSHLLPHLNPPPLLPTLPPSPPPPLLLPPPPPPLPPLPPPPLLLSSCLAPLAHCYCRHRHFCCSLLIVVSPAVATAAAATRYRCRRRFCCSLLIVVSPTVATAPPPPLLAIAATAAFTAL